MAKPQQEVYFVFMNFDPVYERLRADRSKQGSATLDAYLSQKHDKLLARFLPPDTYWKKSSLAIVDGFAVEITDAQASVLMSAKEVRVVEKNQELLLDQPDISEQREACMLDQPAIQELA